MNVFSIEDFKNECYVEHSKVLICLHYIQFNRKKDLLDFFCINRQAVTKTIDFLQINQYIRIDHQKRLIVLSVLKQWIEKNLKYLFDNLQKNESGRFFVEKIQKNTLVMLFKE